MLAPKRVLFLSANTGTGHSSAAEAVLRALQERDPSIEGRLIHSFKFASQTIGKMVEDGYMQMLKSFPTLYGLLYESQDDPSTVSGVRRWLNNQFVGNFKNLLDEYQPHAIVCTHAFPFGIMAAIKEKFGLQVPCLGVVTDFVAHPYWLCPNMDRYAVGTPELSRQLTLRGIPMGAISVTGIPIDARFGGSYDRVALRRKLDLDVETPLVLVMGGGVGLGPVDKIVRSLRRLRCRSQVVILAGKNDRLRERLSGELERHGLGSRVQVSGYVDNVYEYMSAADLLVTKPGGLTSAEALACGLPMIVVRPLPGPEMKNCKYLLSNKVARVAHERSLHRVLEETLGSPETLSAMRLAAARLARPESAATVASLVCGMVAEQRISGEDSSRRFALRPPLANPVRV